MKVDVKLVERLASLAKLSFDKEEKQRLVKDLERMIGFVDTLDQLDLSNEEANDASSSGKRTSPVG